MTKENRELLSERLAEVSRWLENDAQRLERLWLNDKYWTTGFGLYIAYSCREDYRTWVSKRQKWMGWTINFASDSDATVTARRRHNELVAEKTRLLLDLGLPSEEWCTIM